MKLIIAFLLVTFSIVACALQFGQKDKPQCRKYIDLKASLNTIITKQDLRTITFNKYSGAFVNLKLQSVLEVYCSYMIVPNPNTTIARNREIRSIKLPIQDFLSLFLHHNKSFSVCDCDNAMHTNTSIVTICSVLYQHQNTCFICGCGNTTLISASKVYYNENNNVFIKLHQDESVHINKLKANLNLKTPLSQRVKRAQEHNASLHCPLGFKASYNECDCDPKLVAALPLTKCVKSQLVRPPMSWIGCEKNCTQIMYSKNCFIDYCLLTASYLQLNASSTYDAQCNYGRTGRICGHCHKGYDSVFGAQAKCKKCSNIWLLLIPVFGVAGFLLVIALFVLNLTVTKGLINGFVLYTNILGMENVIIFPLHYKFVATIVDISNLNLGIETCFYKGMTEFDKHWLQLMFPFYLIFIVGLIAMASRYSGRVEKLTRKRVIPVLATLLFLSYNKLLLTTTTVLLYYQPIYHLETNKYEIYWPVDTSVTPFATKFIMLFIVCLIIFVELLIPINVVLLFPTFCFKFKRVIYFKPFIDAFQAPYRDKVRYTIGIELLVRFFAYIFNAVYVVDHYQKFGANVAVFLLYFSYITMIQPYKAFYKTVLHWSFILNFGLILALQIYRFSYINQSSYIVLLYILVTVAYTEFAGIVFYEASKCVLAHSEIIRNFVYNYGINKAESQQEISRDVENPQVQGDDEFQEELLGISN